jgi:vacuolar-type H+-ATPase subunit I/STV1
VRVINVECNGEVVKKRCPMCSGVFFNTHRLSIHIYKHHRALLGSVHKAASSEALRLYELQLRKLGVTGVQESEEQIEDDDDEDEVNGEDGDEEGDLEYDEEENYDEAAYGDEDVLDESGITSAVLASAVVGHDEEALAAKK